MREAKTDSGEPSTEAGPPTPVATGEVPELLADLKREADDWIAEHSDQYDPFQWSDLEKRAVRRKAICEASVYLHVAESMDDLATPDLKDLVVDRVNDPRYYHLLARKPQEIHKFGYPVAYVARHADLVDDAGEMMQRSLRRPSVTGLERKPFRVLDIWHLCRMYGFEDHHVDFQSVLETSCGRGFVSPIESSRENTYELTHVILYAHNFGSGDDRFPTDPLDYQYSESQEGLLLRYLADDDCDLVSELLLCGALENALPPGLVEFALGWLADRIDDSGYVPGPEGSGLPVGAKKDAPELQDLNLGDWDDESETWGRNYHPTMVVGMMTRVLADRWDDIDRPDRRRDLDYEAQAENLVDLGDLFWTLAGYDLKEGAETFRRLLDTPVADAYPELFRVVAEFFEHQQRPDGEFGYWTDERRVFLSMDPSHDEAAFESEMLEPISESCASALAAYRDRFGPVEHH